MSVFDHPVVRGAMFFFVVSGSVLLGELIFRGPDLRIALAILGVSVLLLVGTFLLAFAGDEPPSGVPGTDELRRELARDAAVDVGDISKVPIVDLREENWHWGAGGREIVYGSPRNRIEWRVLSEPGETETLFAWVRGVEGWTVYAFSPDLRVRQY
mgnify:CR=1 FL=1